MACETIKGVFIPDCWGGVRHGRPGCYCREESGRAIADQRIARLEESVKRLSEQVRELMKAKP